jgi:hypothetical protein
VISQKQGVTQILPVYNSGAKVLELRAMDESDFGPMDINMIKFGDSMKDVNFCNMTTSFRYMVKEGTKPTDTGRTVTYELVNKD